MDIIYYQIQQIAMMIQFYLEDIIYHLLIMNIINVITNVELVKKLVQMKILIAYHVLIIHFFLD